MATLPPPIPPSILAYNNGGTLLAITTTFFTAAALVVIARYYTRIFVVKSIGSDDWTMLVAMLFATVSFALYAREISLGVGKHIVVVISSEERNRELLKLRFIHMVTIVVGISLVKISASLLLMRLVPRTYAWFLWSVICFITVFTIGCAGSLIFQCTPIQAIWDTTLRLPPLGTGHARCMSSSTFINIGLFNGIINILTDFLLALLPVPLIWNLQIPLRTRLMLVLVLSLGLFGAAAGVIRQQTIREGQTAEPLIHDSYTIWSFIELDVGIIAASLSALKPLFKKFFDTVRSTVRSFNRVTQGSSGVRHRSYRPDGEESALATLEAHSPHGGVFMHSDVQIQGNKSVSRREHGSTENILPSGHLNNNKSGIMVTKQFQMERTISPVHPDVI